MKIKDEFVYVLVYLLLSVLMILIPQNNEPIFTLLHWVGVEFYIVSGVYFLGGLIKKIKRLILSGLIFGIFSWVLLLLCSINSASINISVIEFWHNINTLESFKLITPVIEVDLPAYIISEILYGINVNYIINSIGLIILTIIGCVLEVFVFIKISEEEEEEEEEDDDDDEDDDDEDDDDEDDDDEDDDDEES